MNTRRPRPKSRTKLVLNRPTSPYQGLKFDLRGRYSSSQSVPEVLMFTSPYHRCSPVPKIASGPDKPRLLYSIIVRGHIHGVEGFI